MTDKIYKEWQEGASMNDLCDKYFLTHHQMRRMLEATPKERICKRCGELFRVGTKTMFCSPKCCVAYHSSGKTSVKRKKAKKLSLDDFLAELNAKGMAYNECQTQETKQMLWGGEDVKYNCFAYDDVVKGCKALNELYCRKDKCKFYKTKKEYQEGLEKYPSLTADELKLLKG